ncbi:Threonine/homoserine efflux transporter RhtA [Oscillibacter sp. PC13]|uniref:DMT family transporter n=1 Tax=Oscillibacter sp. PC13 TaxID=1855299 RepID=UPI0008F24D63|nr:DMT family transporter [Oscillibacter sp. PC13]SFP44630.1 Threonine/homoserine efflux transporter RhtA [Oscillibacter sp. PC13]
MSQQTSPYVSRGILCTIAGGICWGFSGACGQYLFSHYGISPLWLTCVRLLVGGILLTLIAFPRHREKMQNIWKHPKDVFFLVLYGVFGLFMFQFAFMTAVSYSNAATATVLQTLNLVLIMLFTCLRMRRRPNRLELISLLLALFGTFLIATGGDPAHLVISTRGLFWGLANAVAMAFYTLLPRSMLPVWGAEVMTGYGMLIGGIVSNLFAHSWEITVSLPLPGWLAVLAIIIVGTVMSFTLYTQGVSDIGPVRASMLACTEPLAATLFSFLWLGTTFSPADLLGFSAILAIIFLLSKTQ